MPGTQALDPLELARIASITAPHGHQEGSDSTRMVVDAGDVSLEAGPNSSTPPGTPRGKKRRHSATPPSKQFPRGAGNEEDDESSSEPDYEELDAENRVNRGKAAKKLKKRS